MVSAERKLEKYFSKHHPKKYAEVGGSFTVLSMEATVRIQKYFTSGKYKELEDPKLNELWAAVEKNTNKLHKFLFFGIFIILIYLLFTGKIK